MATQRKARTSTRTRTRTSTAASRAAGPTITVNVTVPAAVTALKRTGTARANSIALAQQYNGKPLSQFKAAWQKAAASGGIHHSQSVYTQGTSKSPKLAQQGHQNFTGWLAWLKRTGIVTVNQ